MPNLGQIRQFLQPCDLEIWRMTLKNNRAPLLSNIKLCALSSYENSNWSYGAETAKLGFDLCELDLWPWPFAWISLLSLVKMMMRWNEHSEKGMIDGQTEPFIRWRTTVVRGPPSNEVHTSNGVCHDVRILRGAPTILFFTFVVIAQLLSPIWLAKLENIISNTLIYI